MTNIKRYLKYILDDLSSLEKVNDVLDTLTKKDIITCDKNRRKLYFFFTRMRVSSGYYLVMKKELMIYQMRNDGSYGCIPFRMLVYLFDYLLIDEFEEYPIFHKDSTTVILRMFKEYLNCMEIDESELMLRVG